MGEGMLEMRCGGCVFDKVRCWECHYTARTPIVIESDDEEDLFGDDSFIVEINNTSS